MTAQDVETQLAELESMTIPELQSRHLELLESQTATHNKRHLIRKLAWHIQSAAFGGISERALERAQQLARDSDIRVRPPKDFESPRHATVTVPISTDRRASDDRLPPAGSVLSKHYKGRKLLVTVRDDGFEYDGQRYRSLSAVAKAISGSHHNGYRFFNLLESR